MANRRKKAGLLLAGDPAGGDVEACLHLQEHYNLETSECQIDIYDVDFPQLLDGLRDLRGKLARDLARADRMIAAIEALAREAA